ncbi:MAG: iron chelate uptake ABC transporter family permease subunit [Eubacteriales bacterium]|nr:iron chelate uptake ABC transporter family permease subunit [Eubacteriales bacterium]
MKKSTSAIRAKSRRKFAVLVLLSLIFIALYMTVNVRFDHPKLFAYAMNQRSTKVMVMIVVAFAIGAASMVFQSIINNTIVTPCLLGMNSLYSLVHTAVVFFLGSGSVLARNSNLSFLVDLAIMGVVATLTYSCIFKKTKYNVLYVLLIGTVLTSFFSSIQTTLVRAMDPNEYETLLSSLVASFSNINDSILLLAVILMVCVVVALRKEIAVLDVITLGKEQAINLGVDYDRTIRKLLLGVVLLISVATALVGPISFFGLIVANLARQLFKTYRHTELILGSVLIGVVLLTAGQLIVEQVYSYGIPISVFITVGGGLYFLYLLLAQRRRK